MWSEISKRIDLFRIEWGVRMGVVATRPRTVTPELALRVNIKARAPEHTFWKSLASLSGMNVFAVFVLTVRIKLASNFLLGCF